MAGYWALIVASDRFIEPALGLVPFAEAGAKRLSHALTSVGYPAANQVVLLGSHATRTLIASRIRKLKKAVKRGDTLLIYWSGRAFSRKGKGLLACWDSHPDDLQKTAFPVRELLADITGSVFFLFDPVGGPAVSGFESGLDDRELASQRVTALLAGDVSHRAAGLEGSAWTHLVIEALSGRAAKAIDGSGSVTARSLHEFVEGELPRVLRKHFEPGTSQSPRLLGDERAAVAMADFSSLDRRSNGPWLDPERLKRVSFRSESTSRVKDLLKWKKTYELPTHAGASSQKFVARMASADVQSDLETVFEAAREHLGHRRKDVEVVAGGDGVGTVRTPDFEYTVAATLDPTEPSHLNWLREVGRFADAGFVRGPGFEALFGKRFDQLVFEFAQPVNVGDVVDRLEERPPKGVKVQTASDGSSCDISLAGFTGRVTVKRKSLIVRGRAGGLLDQFLAFLHQVGPIGEQLMLPAK